MGYAPAGRRSGPQNLVDLTEPRKTGSDRSEISGGALYYCDKICFRQCFGAHDPPDTRQRGPIKRKGYKINPDSRWTILRMKKTTLDPMHAILCRRVPARIFTCTCATLPKKGLLHPALRPTCRYINLMRCKNLTRTLSIKPQRSHPKNTSMHRLARRTLR